MVLQELFVALVLCAVAFAWAARRLRVPYPVMLVAGGGLLGFVPELPPLKLEPDLVAGLSIPVVVALTAIGVHKIHKLVAHERGPGDGEDEPRDRLP